MALKMSPNDNERLDRDVHPYHTSLQRSNDWDSESNIDNGDYKNEDYHEETTTCSSFFSRTNIDPVLSIGKSEQKTMSSFLRQCTSTNKQDDSVLGCVSPPALPRSSSWSTFEELPYTEEEMDMEEGDEPTDESNLRPTHDGFRHFWVVTTAALPWMTGTAVNPLLRAATLSQLNRPYANVSTVTLVIPWLESAEERVTLYGNDWEGAKPSDQEAFVRSWLANQADLPLEADEDQGGIKILFYPARYVSAWGSIFATGDICSWIPDDCITDVCFLEEPEHLNVFRAPGKNSWTDRFRHVVGVVHTNYKAYASAHYSGLVSTPVISACCSLVVTAACHRVVKLSPVLQCFAPEKEVVSNVHGVRKEFLEEGSRRARYGGENGVYFVGKLLWAKGFDKMLALQEAHLRVTGSYFPIDIYGSGPEQMDIQKAFRGHDKPHVSDESSTRVLPMFRREPIPANFLGRKDHAALTRDYKVFVNPSLSEVLCTTTAEALAMGKFALVPNHPSNVFFAQFPNCLQYNNKLEFVALLQYALSHEPEPLTEELGYQFTWEAATDRCLNASVITKREKCRRVRAGQAKRDERAAKIHYELNKGIKGAVIRRMMGTGPVEDMEMLRIGSAVPNTIATD